MSPKLPILKSKEVVNALEKLGYRRHRQTGSHLIMIKDGSSIQPIVPIHNCDLKKGTLRAIIRETGCTVEEFCNFL